MRSGVAFYGKIKDYKIPGIDFTGSVVESNSPDYKMGDKVCGLVSPIKNGSHAEYVVVPASRTFKLPDNIEEKNLTALLTPVATVNQLFSKIDMRHKKILVNGCSGAVGKCLSQILLKENKEVYGISSKRQFEGMKKSGMEHLYDYTAPVPYHTIAPFDVIFDCNGNLRYADLKKFMNPKSLFIAISIKEGMRQIGSITFEQYLVAKNTNILM